MSWYSYITLPIICLTAVKCKTVRPYSNEEGPSFLRIDSKYELSSFDTLQVISYNIEYGLESEAVSYWLKDTLDTNQGFVIFLQELDEQDFSLIAEQLSANYIYHPISYEPKYDKNFGNGIVSNLTIMNTDKILLDETKLNGRKRSATYAQVSWGKQIIHTYSIHLETMVMSRKKRINQLRSLVSNINSIQKNEAIILAGDFNCISYDMRQKYRQALLKAELTEITQSIGPTLYLPLKIPARTDLVFSRGLKALHCIRSQPNKDWSDHAAVFSLLTTDH